MAMLIGIVAGVAVFFLWMSMVGNPHVVETVMGLVLAVVVWIAVWFQVSKLIRWFSRR